MTGNENLTRAEAQERASLIESHAFDVRLDLTTGAETFATTTTAQFGCRAPGSSTWIDLIAPSVTSVVLNGASLDIAACFEGSRISLPNLLAENTLVVEAIGAYMNTGEGLHRFVDPVDPVNGARLKVPHMGWNGVRQTRPHALWTGIADEERFYFVHSYYVAPVDPVLIAAETDYGAVFTSAIARDNIFATQFHPEKSAAHGLALYRNFLRWKP